MQRPESVGCDQHCIIRVDSRQTCAMQCLVMQTGKRRRFCIPRPMDTPGGPKPSRAWRTRAEPEAVWSRVAQRMGTSAAAMCRRVQPQNPFCVSSLPFVCAPCTRGPCNYGRDPYVHCLRTQYIPQCWSWTTFFFLCRTLVQIWFVLAVPFFSPAVLVIGRLWKSRRGPDVKNRQCKYIYTSGWLRQPPV